MKEIVLTSLIALFVVPAFSQDDESTRMEPDMQQALLWWPDQKNVWTPVGWKDHFFRFNVIYNGAIMAMPAPRWGWIRENVKPWLHKDVLISVSTRSDGNPVPIPKARISSWKVDGGYGDQGWDNGHETPVLWTDYKSQEGGAIIRQEFFSHVKGSVNVHTGIEPLFGWIRLKVTHVDPFRHSDTLPVVVQVSRSYYDHVERGEYAVSLDVNPETKKYHNLLTARIHTESDKQILDVLEPDEKIRLSVISTNTLTDSSFFEIEEGVYGIRLFLKTEVGEYVDVLLPMLAEEKTTVQLERSLGFDGALRSSDNYWRQTKSQGATIDIPEEYINEVVSNSVKLAQIIAEKNNLNAEYSYLSGSFAYDYLWSTPTSMISHMFMDPLGHFDLTEKYSAIFLKNQGTVKPPGKAYSMDAGYFSTPKTLTSIDWLSDHGAILLQVATHALLSGDKEFYAHWENAIIKACDFIKNNSELTDHDGVKGLLPPAVATDDWIETQAIWNLAWNYKGLTTAVRLLKKNNHPRAAEFELFSDKFKEIFQKSYRELTLSGPTWVDSKGKVRFKPPTSMSPHMPQHQFSDAFYLDTGPMVLVWAGLMDAADPIMLDVVEFFRDGPNKKLWPAMYSALHRPWLDREISTCEPCYSWNVFHSWQLNDRSRFLEGMYSLYAGALSQDTYISCEHRHGIQGNLFATPLAVYLSRLAVIDDQIDPDALHIMRICPLAWISSTQETIFDNMPTEYGPVNLRFMKSADGKNLDIKFEGKWRVKPNNVIIHVPPLSGLTSLSVNGKKYSSKVKQITLPSF